MTASRLPHAQPESAQVDRDRLVQSRSWRSLGTYCRERDCSKQRLLYELRHGLPHRTVPPGYEPAIDWHHPNVERSLDVAASTVMVMQPVLMADGVPDLDCRTVGVEVLPPTEAATPASGSAQWAMAATRRLRTANKIPDGVMKADLARLLEAPWGIWPLNSFE